MCEAQCVAMGGCVDVWGSVCSYGWLCVSDVSGQVGTLSRVIKVYQECI